jgi:hypothetical protein
MDGKFTFYVHGDPSLVEIVDDSWVLAKIPDEGLSLESKLMS